MQKSVKTILESKMKNFLILHNLKGQITALEKSREKVFTLKNSDSRFPFGECACIMRFQFKQIP